MNRLDIASYCLIVKIVDYFHILSVINTTYSTKCIEGECTQNQGLAFAYAVSSANGFG